MESGDQTAQQLSTFTSKAFVQQYPFSAPKAFSTISSSKAIMVKQHRLIFLLLTLKFAYCLLDGLAGRSCRDRVLLFVFPSNLSPRPSCFLASWNAWYSSCCIGGLTTSFVTSTISSIYNRRRRAIRTSARACFGHLLVRGAGSSFRSE
ncbi:hypothetical protein BC939DRAFT_465571 [Gamsiella multidivaricata]|uniref:uncharacterized protein n=1 Tax=Gamsiella multidivaricata TaxID=101098 RepID=UPI00221FE824|nr:uncharacterized protein BC939DRAFT_465571 [Gamsiella multidivaricata]KAI7817598.1 hypothetical protein BC939DRAFT_465571 [Gamsiella multidivaricata]